jgi:hypothetical protein
MQKTKPDDSAFPTPHFATGLTKREYFALHLMAGHLSGDGAYCSGSETGTLDTPELAARKAILYADALIEALNADT